jgi:hypothetical protein
MPGPRRARGERQGAGLHDVRLNAASLIGLAWHVAGWEIREHRPWQARMVRTRKALAAASTALLVGCATPGQPVRADAPHQVPVMRVSNGA